jgi:glycosyltransferase involved in cell wall biosynthesis
MGLKNNHFSVLLSLYDKEKPEYLDQSLSSIWDDQTLKPNQIVLVKDGPLTPELDTLVLEWQEKLGGILTVVALPKNIGLGAALNEGLKYCKHGLVARMDADDISMPDRFEKQIAFFENNEGAVIVGSSIFEFYEGE